MVAEQAEPDPDFPTVAFPNPEEPGAIDLALALAEEVGADLVVANDPDADRCAVAAPSTARWRMLRGDELGCLLGDDALRRGVRGTYACSIVSSSLLSAMAAAYDQPFVYTLTGFKWIGRVPGLAFGYEEAIGYCVDPEAVPDKDGISALLRVLTLAAGLKADGLHRCRSARRDRQDLRRLRDRPARGAGRRPQPDRRGHGPAPRPAARPSCSASRSPSVDLAARQPGPAAHRRPVLITGDSIKAVVRPSGTEPKLKCYLEARSPVTSADDLGGDRRRTRDALSRLRAEMSVALGLSAS